MFSHCPAYSISFKSCGCLPATWLYKIWQVCFLNVPKTGQTKYLLISRPPHFSMQKWAIFYLDFSPFLGLPSQCSNIYLNRLSFGISGRTFPCVFEGFSWVFPRALLFFCPISLKNYFSWAFLTLSFCWGAGILGKNPVSLSGTGFMLSVCLNLPACLASQRTVLWAFQLVMSSLTWISDRKVYQLPNAWEHPFPFDLISWSNPWTPWVSDITHEMSPLLPRLTTSFAGEWSCNLGVCTHFVIISCLTHTLNHSSPCGIYGFFSRMGSSCT